MRAGRLKDRVIVITGASSGIGAATAIACAEAGMHVALTARRADRLDDVAASVRDRGVEAMCVVGDVADADLSGRLLDAATDRFGHFDAVFANAGYGTQTPLLDESLVEMRRAFEVNHFAATGLVCEAGRRLVEAQRHGHLLMCSSCLSRFAMPKMGTYAATKAAQHLVCAALRQELAGTGVYVSSVHPITTTTEFHAIARGDDPASAKAPPRHAPKFFVQPPERVAKAIVRCLERPRPEVWTSHIVRLTAAFATAFPRFGDFAIGRRAARDR